MSVVTEVGAVGPTAIAQDHIDSLCERYQNVYGQR